MQQKVRIDLGGGNDTAHFSDSLLGSAVNIDAVIHGGAGHDFIQALFNVDPQTTGQLRAEVDGDAGNDNLELSILGADNLDALFALLDGGSGRDRCKATANVVVQNCP